MEEEVNRIINVVCNYFGMLPGQVFVKSNKREKVRARHFIRYFLRKKTDLSLSKIGIYTNHSDHSTNIKSIRLITDLIEFDKEYQKYHSDLLRIIDKQPRNEFSRKELIKAFELGRNEDFEALNNLLNATHEKEKENNRIGNDSGHSFARIGSQAISSNV